MQSAGDGASLNAFTGWHSEPPFPQLEDVQFVPVTRTITVANLIGQHGVRSARSKAPPPVRYPAMREGLQKVATFARERAASVAMPRIGCGLAGGDWEDIEPVIEETLGAQGIPVSVYDLP